MGKCFKLSLYFLFFIANSFGSQETDENVNDAGNHVLGDVGTVLTRTENKISNYVFWPNATIPFYVVPEHFDREQSISIMTTLALFAFKTCLKFVPGLTPPEVGQHVLVFANPDGVRKCVLSTDGHPRDDPHVVILGYDCLRPPQIDMMLMRALGFPFEHNRASRDLFIDVQFENVDTNAMEFFTKDDKLPMELRALAYDVDSVLHFGERDYSKNGHRTIIFKEISKTPVKQTRHGLSPLDLRKIEIVYGAECRKRDRQEKIELCQNYPGVARRKRDVEYVEHTNLRVNREISPSPNDISNLNNTFKELGIEDEVQAVVDEVYKVSSKALKNARAKYCNISKADLRVSEEKAPRNSSQNNPDILGIIESITEYARNMVENAAANITAFCAASESIELYQRSKPRCGFYGGRECPPTYRSTKFGPVRHSTQHRPTYYASTRNRGYTRHEAYLPMGYRSGNVTEYEGNTTDSAASNDKFDFTTEVNTNLVKGLDDTHKNDDDTVVEGNGGRRDDVTRVINQRSKDDEKTTEKSRRKRLAELTTRNEKENSTNTSNNSPNDNVKATDPVISNDVNLTKADLRSGTDIPGRKPTYDREWPFPERDQRRFVKFIKKPNAQTKNFWADSALSLEKKEELSSEESSESEKEMAVSTTTPTSTTMRKLKMKSERGKRKENRLLKRQKILRSSPLPPTLTSPKDVESYEALNEVEEVQGSDPDPGFTPVVVKLSKLNKEFYDERKWDNGVVPYVLTEDPNYDMNDIRKRLEEVNRILKKKTCVRIEELKEDDVGKYDDYLIIDTGADYVTGRVGGKQNFGSLELYRGGQHRQHAALVVMAMLGFYFELARHDRDKYVRVHLRHVRPDKLHHFEKIRADATFNLPYDYESATHPAWQFWRKLGKTGISTVATYKSKDPNGTVMKSLGQNPQLLSNLDLVKINSVYGTKCFDRDTLRAFKDKHGARGGSPRVPRTF